MEVVGTGRPQTHWVAPELTDRKKQYGRREEPGSDFAFPHSNFVKALLAMLSALRLAAESKHAPRATWQAVTASGRGIQNQPVRAQSELSEMTYLKTSRAVFLPHTRSLESR